VFNVLTAGHISIWAGALISYGIVIIYVATGGVRAAAWSDVLQALLMYVVAWGVGLYLTFHLYGGPGAMFEKVIELKPGLLEIGHEGSKMSPTAFSTAILVSVLGFIMWPHLFMKSFTTDANTVRRTAVAYPVFAIFLVPVLFIGFAGIGVVKASALHSPDEILPYLVANVLQAPGWLYGLIGAGALAAAMSSADAITHGAAVEVIEDVWRTFRPEMPERAVVRLMRWAVVVVGAIAYYVAIFGAAGLVKLLLGAYGSIVQFAPATYGALYWRRSTRAGALAGLVTGVVVNIWFQFHPPTPLGIHAGILGLIANLIVFVVVSLASTPNPEPVVRAFTQPE
jgi:solute:Na+ symporter, SSS family